MWQERIKNGDIEDIFVTKRIYLGLSGETMHDRG